MWTPPHVLYQAGAFSTSGSLEGDSPLNRYIDWGAPHYYYCWTVPLFSII